jgi:hypothetical protein
MWYTGYGGNNTICYATSDNGVSWTRYSSNPVLNKTGINVSCPKVINQNGIFKMWYCQGSGFPSIRDIYYAYSGISISEPVRSPAGDVQPSENITVSVNVSAIQGVDTVLISYTTNRTAGWQNVTMDNVGGSTYQKVIPGQPTDTLVTYKIIANDTFGDSVVKDGAATWCSFPVVPEFSVFSLLLLGISAAVIAMSISRFRPNRFAKQR